MNFLSEATGYFLGAMGVYGVYTVAEKVSKVFDQGVTYYKIRGVLEVLTPLAVSHVGNRLPINDNAKLCLEQAIIIVSCLSGAIFGRNFRNFERISQVGILASAIPIVLNKVYDCLPNKNVAQLGYLIAAVISLWIPNREEM